MQKQLINFITEFQKTNQGFIDKLDNTYPDLTPMQFKICLYIYAGCPSKEIAEQLDTSIRAVENHRYRLRKKFELKKYENITMHLIGL